MRNLGDLDVLRNLFTYATNRNEHVRVKAR